MKCTVPGFSCTAPHSTAQKGHVVHCAENNPTPRHSDWNTKPPKFVPKAVLWVCGTGRMLIEVCSRWMWGYIFSILALMAQTSL